jgi:hypothetical protein
MKKSINNSLKANKSILKKQPSADYNLFKEIISGISNEQITNPLDCSICLDKLVSNKIIYMVGCSHYFCRKCVKLYLTIQMEEEKIDISCPNKDCANIINQSVISQIISLNIIEKYQNKLLDLFVIQSKDMTYCPKPTCSQICIKNECSNKVNCLHCFNQFCFICLQTYKSNHTCDPTILLKNIPKSIIQSFDKDADIKICPSCKYIIQKIDGCNAVTCKSCKTKFCWNCLVIRNEVFLNDDHNCDDYDHDNYLGSSEETEDYDGSDDTS